MLGQGMGQNKEQQVLIMITRGEIEMTQTIEQLTARIAELEEELGRKMSAGQYVLKQLAAAQLQIKTLKEAVDLALSLVPAQTLGPVKFKPLQEQYAIREKITAALSTPQDLSALLADRKRIADAVEKLTVERCAGLIKIQSDGIKASSPIAHDCSLSTCKESESRIRALPLGQIDIGEL